jgi:hypothetical protein
LGADLRVVFQRLEETQEVLRQAQEEHAKCADVLAHRIALHADQEAELLTLREAAAAAAAAGTAACTSLPGEDGDDSVGHAIRAAPEGASEPEGRCREAGQGDGSLQLEALEVMCKNQEALEVMCKASLQRLHRMLADGRDVYSKSLLPLK